MKDVEHVWEWRLERERMEEGRNGGRGMKSLLLRSSNGAAHFSFPTELKRSGNWKGDNPAAKAPQMPMKSFRDIRVLHFGPCLCVSFTWGLWKNVFLMTTPEKKCFPIRPMHHCQHPDETALFLFGWVMPVERQRAEMGNKEGWRERKTDVVGFMNAHCSEM